MAVPPTPIVGAIVDWADGDNTPPSDPPESGPTFTPTADSARGHLDASGVITGYRSWPSANEQDVTWARTVADAFDAAGVFVGRAGAPGPVE